ncbi:MAG: 3-hydroxyacyl-CoA dehydrogenase NAD-binding domain-containing protein [Gammaproteobacteria bacterium]|nr:3-hydroxyacyl-CoA dehydrogenase NAD-binding domain-containing protein [Gammaproteobacteria bacterium]MDH3430346.1 3-hydroxyacyl-CoA dehydrogenase NAD-binding domain-containing protein [Gammaproteobacteria bacterium]MDH3434028.1 3-hydroxyacyl-CoA dehydrogenase NAD-binding domain-containing protein [Gammaproteobacteria bacterium]
MYEINRAAVIGAGTMGLGIAGQLANAGIEVLLLDMPVAGDNRNAIAARALERLLDESQPGLLHKDLIDRITIGNTEDDMEKLADVDWIAEAVVERLDIKKTLYRQIDAVRKEESIVSSNTSTIPISLLVEDMPTAFREEFAITHFFNPVRFMRLLEIVRGEATRPAVIECLEVFADRHLGKGVVICNDTPGFLGNRVGVFAIQMALHTAFRMGLTPEEADAIFGRPMGIPKTGVFGLYDLIGIDLMSDVAGSLVAILPDNDAFHEVSAEIPLMRRMIEDGHIGNKVDKGGFYQSARPAAGTRRRTLDFNSFTYRDFDEHRPQVAIDAELAGDFTLLLDQDDKYGAYAWQIIASTLCYAAALVPEVNDSLVAVDDAMKLGYNWLQGPFEMIDSIGVDRFIARLEKENRDVPDFLRTAAGKSFYRVSDGKLQHLMADGRYRALGRAQGVRRFSEERRTLTPLQENAAASFFQLENNIGLVEFHSKANALGPESMQLLEKAVQHASATMRGLVIHNDAQHFSCGANLESILGFIVNADMAGLDRFLDHYQQTLLAMRNAPIPVVAAPSGLSMGGGFEVLLHTDKVIFHANSVSGLVETLVGVVPGGGGVKEMLYRWYERTGDMRKAAWNAFMNIGYGKTARSPLEAEPLAMFRSGVDEFIMNRDRLLDTALSAVIDISADYTPLHREPLTMPGRDVAAEMAGWLQQALEKGRLTPHDVTTGTQVAMIVTGGDIDAGTTLTENDLLKLERQAFVALGQTEATRSRIEYMLKHGRPLRN